MNSSTTSSEPFSPSLDGLDYNSPAADLRAEIKRLQAMTVPPEQREALAERIEELQMFLELATERGGPVERVEI